MALPLGDACQGTFRSENTLRHSILSLSHDSWDLIHQARWQANTFPRKPPSKGILSSSTAHDRALSVRVCFGFNVFGYFGF